MTIPDANYQDDDLALFVARLKLSPSARSAADASLARLEIVRYDTNKPNDKARTSNPKRV
jgi:hypothetical protein